MELNNSSETGQLINNYINYNIQDYYHYCNYLYSQLTATNQRNFNLEMINSNLNDYLDKKYIQIEELENEINVLHATKICNEIATEKRKPEENNDELPKKRKKIFRKNKDSYPQEKINDILLNLNNINDIINLPEPKYINHEPKLYRLLEIREPLNELNNMIGLDEIKDELFKHIIYFLINKEEIEENNRLHTIIQGPPGVGKTELGKILSKIYLGMGFLKNDKFKLVKRSDLIGEYLGQTAVKTQKVIDSIIGGVLFIDEAYSLGNSEKKDSYSKECLDTINRNLTENGNKFICIIAGYEEDLEKCFFSSNSGLRRRFTFKYSINGYNSEQLAEIFKIKFKDNIWKYEISDEILYEFFKNNEMPYYAGDIDRLIFQVKLIASHRIFKENKNYKCINIYDLNNAIGFVINKNIEVDDYWKRLYM